MRAVVGEIAGDAREQVLKAFVGHQVAVAEHGLAEVGQVPVARRVGFVRINHLQHRGQKLAFSSLHLVLALAELVFSSCSFSSCAFSF